MNLHPPSSPSTMRCLYDAISAVAAKAALGVGATTSSFALSLLPHIEAWLRVASLGVGIAVGLASFVSIVMRIKYKDWGND